MEDELNSVNSGRKQKSLNQFKQDRGLIESADFDTESNISIPDLDETIDLSKFSGKSTGINLPSSDEVRNARESDKALDIDSLFAPSELETSTNDLVGDILSLTRDVSGEDAFRKQKESEFGVQETSDEATNIFSSFQSLQDQAAAIPLQVEEEAFGRMQSAGVGQSISTSRLRRNAIAQLSSSTAYRNAKTKLETKVLQVQNAVDQRFDAKKRVLDLAQKQYATILPLLTIEQKRRGDKVNAFLNERTRLIDEEKRVTMFKETTALRAKEYGADAETIQRISDSETGLEAISAAGSFLSDPLTNLRKEQIIESIASSKAQTSLAFATFNQNKTLLDEQRRANAIALSIQAQADRRAENDRIDVQVNDLDTKIGEIEAILNPEKPEGNMFTSMLRGIFTTQDEQVAGFSSAVGPNKLARGLNLTGQKGQALATISQVIDRKTLQSLGDAKALGITFGALNQEELKTVARAGTALAAVVKYDAAGNVTKITASEDFVIEQLAIIQDAYQKQKERTLNSYHDDNTILNGKSEFDSL